MPDGNILHWNSFKCRVKEMLMLEHNVAILFFKDSFVSSEDDGEK